ncbi:glycosyltransferase [Patescibacteria group bacterium]
MKVAVVYDRVNKIGGAEHVLKNIHSIWPKAPIFTSVYNKKTAPWADGIKVIPSFIQKIPFSKTNHEWFFWAMPFAFETFTFDDFDVVISVSSAQAKAAVTKPNTLHISYLLTPTKYLYSHKKLHLEKNPLGKVGELILKNIWKHEERWDQIVVRRPDKIVTISETVDKRVKKYYKINSDEIIHPPVDTNKFSEKSLFIPEQKNYYLVVSRLVPSKRINLAIKAFNKLNKTLIVVGSGREKKNLKKIAHKNIHFVGQVSDQELVGYYQNCKAVIFPQEEDFGIVAVEALASGKPVVAYKKGGASEIIQHKKHGLLFDRQTPSHIMKVIQSNTNVKFNQHALKEKAKEFDSSVFKTKFKQYVEEEWKTHKKII